MKKRFIRLMLILFIAFGAYTAITINEQKPACAVCCECIAWPSVVQGFYSMIENVGGSLYSSVQELGQSFFDMKQEEAEQTEEDMRAMAAQDRASEVERAKAEAKQEEASMAIKKTLEYQVDQFEDIKEHPAPSEQVCADVTHQQLKNQARQEANFQKEVNKKRANRRRNVESGSLYSRGHTAAKSVLNESLSEHCSVDENNGAMAAICDSGPGDEMVDAHKRPSQLFLDGNTLSTQEEQDAAELAIIMAGPQQTVALVPETVNTDPEMAMLYLGSIKEAARKSIQQDTLSTLKANVMPMTSDCGQAKALVQEVSQKAHGVPDYWELNGGCPSLSTLEEAEMWRLLNVEDGVETVTDWKGNQRSVSNYMKTLKVRQAYRKKLEAERKFLNVAVQTLSAD